MGIVASSDGAREVGAHQDRAPSHPVDPYAGRQGEQDPRQEADDAEDSHLERVRRGGSVIATNGSAMPVISSPNWLIVWAVQSFMKSPWRQRLGRLGDTAVSSSAHEGSGEVEDLERHQLAPALLRAQSGT